MDTSVTLLQGMTKVQEPEPMPPGKGRRNLEATPGPPDSGGPLLLLQPAVLFVTGDADDLCNLSHLRQVCKDMQSSDIRFVVMKGADATLKPPQARSHNAAVVRNVADTVLEFAEALNNNSLHRSTLPKFVPTDSEEVLSGPAATAPTAGAAVATGSRPVTAEVGASAQAPVPDVHLSNPEQPLPQAQQTVSLPQVIHNTEAQRQASEPEQAMLHPHAMPHREAEQHQQEVQPQQYDRLSSEPSTHLQET